MQQGQNDTPIIVALDVPSHESAITLAKQLDPKRCRVKVGLELYTAAGPAVVEALQKLGFDVFLDLKLKDIPNTVAGAVRSACGLGVWMLNVHVDGGLDMMCSAVKAVKDASHHPLLIGVTVLTSMDVQALKQVGVSNVRRSAQPQVIKLSRLAHQARLDGVVCSGKEIRGVLSSWLEDMFNSSDKTGEKPPIIVTPGIRLSDGNKNDQKRIVTPESAIRLGANYLVVGRPITEAPDPLEALQDFNERVRLARARRA